MVLAASVGAWIGAFLILLIWIALAFWPARVAGRKGHSFIGYFILSLFFFPLALDPGLRREGPTRHVRRPERADPPGPVGRRGRG